ncbi:MAG: putative nucleocapsid protein [Alphanucleorhabdovirus xinjianensis]|uniref:Nucleoprotein n=1 Tax=Xinjiang nucleorhabdovirus TaxID=2824629 RepID=A0AAE8BES1_9RHAB|nr:MAG: putative nucleocapsid protein [Xinjiang nucleorhabdovirus]
MARYDADDIISTLNRLVEEGEFKDWQDRADIPAVSGKPEQTEYTDAVYKSKILKYIALNKVTNSQMVIDWSNVQKDLKDGPTESTLRKIIVLGANLRGLEGTAAEPATDLTKVTFPPGATEAATADTKKIVVGAVVSAQQLDATPSTQASNETDDETTQAKAIGFLCCTLIRLINRTPESYLRALPQIKMSFGKFYGEQSVTVSSFAPSMQALSAIATGLSTYRHCANTISLWLATAEAEVSKSSRNFGLFRYLLFQHCEMVGMQLYKLTMQILAALPEMNPAEFLESVRVNDSKKGISTIYKIVRELDNPSRNPKTYYWKYAKLVDSTFFLNLSMSRNLLLGYVLALIMNDQGLVTGNEYSNPKNIKALEAVQGVMKQRAETLADNFSKIYRVLEEERGTGLGLAAQMMKGKPLSASRETQKRGADAPATSTKRAKSGNQPPAATTTPPTETEPSAEDMELEGETEAQKATRLAVQTGPKL